MKILLSIALICALVTFAAWPTANASSSTSIQEEKKSASGHEMLEKEMKRLKGATRRLRKKFRSQEVKAADVLADLRSCQTALMASKNVFPENLTGKKHEKSRAAYTGVMIDCLMEALKAEKAALANDMKKAQTSFKAMIALQKSGHDKFRE